MIVKPQSANTSAVVVIKEDYGELIRCTHFVFFKKKFNYLRVTRFYFKR